MQVLQFKAKQKRFIGTKEVTITVKDSQIQIAGKGSVQTFPIDFEEYLVIDWDYKSDISKRLLQGFKIYGKETLEFQANPAELEQLQEYLMGKILFHNIAEFFIPDKEISYSDQSTVLVGHKYKSSEKFAIKAVERFNRTTGKGLFEKFRNEIKYLKKARELTPHVVEFVQPFQGESNHYIIMQYVQGPNLKNLLEQNNITCKHLEQSEVFLMAEQIVYAYSLLHEGGILHGNVSPENLLVGQDNFIWLIDFGEARLIKEQENLKEDIKNNLPEEYMAPETKLSGVYDVKSEIYSVGMVLYSIFKGKPELRQSKSMKQISNKTLSPKGQFQFADLLPEQSDLLQKLLQADPEKRISLREALQHFYFKPNLRKPAVSIQEYRSVAEETEVQKPSSDDCIKHSNSVSRDCSPISLRTFPDISWLINHGKKSIIINQSQIQATYQVHMSD